MLFKTFRAAAAALLIATGVVAVGTVAVTTTAEAAARKEVAAKLNVAISQARANNLSAARSALAAAEGMSGLTPGDQAAIAQVRQYIAAQGGSGGGSGCAALYLKGDYRGVIATHPKDSQCTQLTAQAYYITHDFASCVRFIKQNFGDGAGEQILALEMSCAYQSGDSVTTRTTLELLVARTNKPEYWSRLLDTAAGAKGISDHSTLDVYRIKLLTGNLTKKDDYLLLAQLALQFGFAAESAAVTQKGIDAKVLTDDRSTRLLNLAKTQAAANVAKFAKDATGNGDTLVKLGEDLWGQGKYPDALKLIQAGIAKGVTDKDNAQIRLGMALLNNGQKDAAIKAFNKVTDPKQLVGAHLWAIYARTH
jgi:tetratricopeptide (TPR) repeat protein